jgi:type I restriction enzyme S subunit
VELRRGYKQTEVGVIPSEWDAMPLDTVARVTSGKRLPLGRSLTRTETPYPYIRVTDMRPGTVSLEGMMFVPPDVYPSIRAYRIFKEDIFISVAGTLGLVGRIPIELDGANLTENADRITDISCVRDYLLQVLASPLIQRAIDSLRTVGAQPKLALARIRKFDIPLPRKRTEQERVAEALGNADALIESLEQLLAKKLHLKQGTIQILVTGRRRLPGFDGKWIARRLRECLLSRPDYGINAPSVPQECDLPSYLRITDIREDGRLDGSARVAVRHPMAGAYFLGENEIVFARTGASVGKTYLYDKNDGLLVFAGFLVRARVDTRVLCPGFLAGITRTSRYWNWVRMMSMRSGQPGINGNEYAKLVVLLPPTLKEQTAIADVLSDMDAGIAAIEAKLAKARLVKQGMMQELLTGRIRLV